MKIWSILVEIFVVIIMPFFLQIKKTFRFIYTFLTQKFEKNLIHALLIIIGLGVVFCGILVVHGWFTGLPSNKTPASITYSDPAPDYDGTSPPQLEIVEESSVFSENILDAGETATLSIRIQNVGSGDAKNVTIQIVMLSGNLLGLSFPKTTPVPPIKAGGEETVSIPVKGKANLSNGKAEIQIYLVDSNSRQKIPIQPFTIETRKSPTPELKLGQCVALEKNETSPNGQIDLNEQIELRFYVVNMGVGIAENVVVKVENTQAGVTWTGAKNEIGQKIRTLTFAKIGKKGEKDHQLIEYTYHINSDFKDRRLVFKISATELHKKYGFSATKKFSINKKPKDSGEIRINPDDDEASLHKTRSKTTIS